MTQQTSDFPPTTSIEIISEIEIAAGGKGMLHHQAKSPLLLQDVALAPGAEIVKIVAGPFNITLDEGKTWRESILAKQAHGLPVSPGTFINLHVKNVSEEARKIAGLIAVIEMTMAPGPAATAQVVQPQTEQAQIVGGPQVVGASSLQPNKFQSAGRPTPAQIAQNQRRGIQAQATKPLGNNGGVMQVLPPIIGGTRPAQGVGGGGSANANQVIKQGSQVVSQTPFTNGNQTFSQRRSTRTVERVLPRVQHHGKGPAASAKSTPATPASEPAAVETPQVETKAELVVAEVRHEQVMLPNQPNERSILFTKGHAYGLLAMLQRKGPLNQAFVSPILGAFSSAMKRSADEEVRGSAGEIVVVLTTKEIGELANVMRRGAGMATPKEQNVHLIAAFQKAFDVEAAVRNANAPVKKSRVTANPAPSGAEAVST